MSTVSYTPTYKDKSACTHTKTPAESPLYISSLVIFCILPLSANTITCHKFSKTSHGFFTLSKILKFCQPASTITTSGLGNYEQPNEINHWPPVLPCTLVRLIIFLQSHTTKLLVYCPPKILKPAKVSSFDLLRPDVLANVNNWLISIKYHDK